MLKAGLIAGGVAFILVLIGAAGVSPFCAICVPLVSGLLAGYLTGVFDSPAPEERTKRGASAGAIAGALALVAGLIAAIINAVVLQNPDNQINELFDMPATSPAMVWAGQIVINLCVGLVNIGLNAALGAGGIAIWSNTAGKNSNVEPPVSM
ncbi:MAG: hypothetical protein R3307_04390 [Anaerolineales bacterium]|nr:hypothetical protein [Anaerolineales bacterium]